MACEFDNCEEDRITGRGPEKGWDWRAVGKSQPGDTMGAGLQTEGRAVQRPQHGHELGGFVGGPPRPAQKAVRTTCRLELHLPARSREQPALGKLPHQGLPVISRKPWSDVRTANGEASVGSHWRAALPPWHRRCPGPAFKAPGRPFPREPRTWRWEGPHFSEGAEAGPEWRSWSAPAPRPPPLLPGAQTSITSLL